MTKTIMFLPLLATLGCHERVIAVSPPVPENPGLMTVTGSAPLEVSPDCADLTMTLSPHTTGPGAATSAGDGKEQPLIAALTKQGAQPKAMNLSPATLEP